MCGACWQEEHPNLRLARAHNKKQRVKAEAALADRLSVLYECVAVVRRLCTSAPPPAVLGPTDGQRCALPSPTVRCGRPYDRYRDRIFQGEAMYRQQVRVSCTVHVCVLPRGSMERRSRLDV